MSWRLRRQAGDDQHGDLRRNQQQAGLRRFGPVLVISDYERSATPGEEMTKTPGEFQPTKPITKEEREARKAFREVDAEKAMS
jgi:hypothetical protein